MFSLYMETNENVAALHPIQCLKEKPNGFGTQLDKKSGQYYCHSNYDLDVATEEESETQDRQEPGLLICSFPIEPLTMQNIYIA